MATFVATALTTYGIDMIELGETQSYDDYDTVTIANSSQIQVQGYEDGLGASYVDNWYGSGFVINPQTLELIGGTLTGYSKSISGIGSITASNINLPAATAYSYIQTRNDISGFIAAVLNGNDSITGSSANDVLKGFGGNDIIDGGLGRDTAAFSGFRANYTVSATNAVVTVKDNSGTDGTDTLTNIERVAFNDKKIAFDVQVGGNAEQTISFIGTVAPTLLQDNSVRGLILELFDQGMSMSQLCSLALDLNLVPHNNASALANQICYNVTGNSPAALGISTVLEDYINQFGETKFLETIAGLHLNIDLVGLQQTGLEFS
jgi:serralysin